MRRRSLARWTFHTVAGLVIWGLQFAIGYALAALACARGWYDTGMVGIPLVRVAMLVTVACALAGCSLIFFRTLGVMRHSRAAPDSTTAFLHAITCGIAVFSFIGIAWTALIIPVPLQCPVTASG